MSATRCLTVDDCMEEVELLSETQLHEVEATAHFQQSTHPDSDLLVHVREVRRLMVNGCRAEARQSLVTLMEISKPGQSSQANEVGGSFIDFVFGAGKTIWPTAQIGADSNQSS